MVPRLREVRGLMFRDCSVMGRCRIRALCLVGSGWELDVTY